MVLKKWIISPNHVSPNCTKCLVQFRRQIKTSHCIKFNLYFNKNRKKIRTREVLEDSSKESKPLWEVHR